MNLGATSGLSSTAPGRPYGRWRFDAWQTRRQRGPCRPQTRRAQPWLRHAGFWCLVVLAAQAELGRWLPGRFASRVGSCHADGVFLRE